MDQLYSRCVACDGRGKVYDSTGLFPGPCHECDSKGFVPIKLRNGMIDVDPIITTENHGSVG